MTRPDNDWTWGNDSPVWLNPRRTIYFIFRVLHGNVEYLRGKSGRMDNVPSQEAVKKALKKLNRSAHAP